MHDCTVTKPLVSFVLPGTQFCCLRMSHTSFFVPGIENNLAHCCQVAKPLIPFLLPGTKLNNVLVLLLFDNCFAPDPVTCSVTEGIF